MLIHTQYPIGATVKNLHTGVIATIKEHGCTSSTDEGIELMLWMEGGAIWKNWNVEVIDTPNTAQSALDHFNTKRAAGILGYIMSDVAAFGSVLNMFIRHVESVDVDHLVIDFVDGSLISFRTSEWCPEGICAQIQDNRA